MDDDRILRIATLLAAHVIFLSAAALRLLRGQRGHWLRPRAAWWIAYYPPLVWLPFLVVYLVPVAPPLGTPARVAGVALAWVSACFAAWGMWSLGRGYGIRLDLFDGHELVTSGPYRWVRHPMYLGILAFHVGASLALASALLLAATVLVVLPYTAVRIAYEDRVLREGFGERFVAYQRRVGALLPRPR